MTELSVFDTDDDPRFQQVIEAAQTQRGRSIMRVLTERGHYLEHPDDFTWAQVDAGSAVLFIEERGQTYRNVWDALIDTGLHGDDELACLRADVAAIRAVLR